MTSRSQTPQTPQTKQTQPTLADLGITPEAASDDYKDAMSAAGRFLARRSHSESELRTKLRRFDPEAIDLVIGRLWELDLLDDAAFAAVWVEERGRRKGRRALESELRAKGVAGHLIEGALAGLAPVELDQATALAASFVRRVARKPLGQQGAAIAQMLVRRGYEWEVAEEAARAVLPPEGWD